MRFERTMIHVILSIPKTHWEKDCWYVLLLKLPVLASMFIVGIPVAIIIDFIGASRDLLD